VGLEQSRVLPDETCSSASCCSEIGVPLVAGAMLLTLVDYRLLLLAEGAVVAAAGAWLLTRAAQGVSASH
jgi:hypothetical protein